jgi:hypothetical protein
MGAEHMIQRLTNSARQPAATETPELMAWQEHRQASGCQKIVPANSPDAKSDTEQEILQSIDEALAALGEDILTKPIPHRLLAVLLKGSTPESET